MKRRRPQPTYHCPVPECEAQLPHGLAWQVVGEIERRKGPVLYECPRCKTTVCQVLVCRGRR